MYCVLIIRSNGNCAIADRENCSAKFWLDPDARPSQITVRDGENCAASSAAWEHGARLGIGRVALFNGNRGGRFTTILMILGWFFFYANERNEPIHIHC